MNSRGQIPLRGVLEAIVVLSMALGIARLLMSVTDPAEAWGILTVIAAAGLGGSLLAELLALRNRDSTLVCAAAGSLGSWLIVLSCTTLVPPWVSCLALVGVWMMLLVFGRLARQRAPSL